MKVRKEAAEGGEEDREQKHEDEREGKRRSENSPNSELASFLARTL